MAGKWYHIKGKNKFMYLGQYTILSISFNIHGRKTIGGNLGILSWKEMPWLTIYILGLYFHVDTIFPQMRKKRGPMILKEGKNGKIQISYQNRLEDDKKCKGCPCIIYEEGKFGVEYHTCNLFQQELTWEKIRCQECIDKFGLAPINLDSLSSRDMLHPLRFIMLLLML